MCDSHHLWWPPASSVLWHPAPQKWPSQLPRSPGWWGSPAGHRMVSMVEISIEILSCCRYMDIIGYILYIYIRIYIYMIYGYMIYGNISYRTYRIYRSIIIGISILYIKYIYIQYVFFICKYIHIRHEIRSCGIYKIIYIRS